jgi:GT2 family glycosyltransferase
LKENAGSSNARNFAVKKTDAHYLFFLDQDDVIFQNSLQLLCEHTNAGNPEWLYGDFLRTDKNLAYQLGQDYYGFQFKNSKDLLCSIFSGQHFFQQNCLYRRHSFESVGGFDMRIAIYQDLDLCIRFALTGHVPLYVPGPLYAHRFHENNLSKLYGRENNPRAHKEDLKSLYETYGISLRSMLTSRQVRKIEDFLTET